MGKSQDAENNVKHSSSSLEKVLKDNQDKLQISRDGFVSIDLTSSKAVKALREQICKFKGVAV